MQRVRWVFAGLLSGLAVAAAAWIVAGCEVGGGTYSLTLTPAKADLTLRNETIAVAVSGGLRDLSLPIEWRVSRPELGRISTAFTGSTAVYVGRASEGVNVIVAEDQYGAVGVATVNHVFSRTNGPSQVVRVSLKASPSPIPAGQNSSTVTATNGAAPYAWSVGDPTYGSVSSGTGNPVTYTSTRAGYNTIYVVDRDGRQGNISILQQ